MRNACRDVQLLLAGFGAFWSAGLVWPKPAKTPPVGTAGAVAIVEVEAGVLVAPPNKLPAAGVVVVFPNRVLAAGAAASVLPVMPSVVALAGFPNPNSPGPVVAGVVEGAAPPNRPPAGAA